MQQAAVGSFRCPYTGEPLELHGAAGEDEISNGLLVSASGLEYPIVDGIPHLIRPELESFTPEEEREKEYYETTAQTYDHVLDWLFKSFYEDEQAVRSQMINLMQIEPTATVLETGAGTCRDTVAIAERLGPEGTLHVQDLSPSMLSIGRERMTAASLTDGSRGTVVFSIANALRLPFPDDFFDAAYHFGGFNIFSDHARGFSEMARVVRTGGRVVVGDEGLAPWLRQTEYGAILANSNQLYGYAAPIDALPVCARRPCLRWLIGNAFWLIDFEVGEGEPAVDLDLEILGRRGGTHRTRYFGKLEGVSPEARRLSEEAAHAAGVSLHQWLDRVIRAAATKD